MTTRPPKARRTPSSRKATERAVAGTDVLSATGKRVSYPSIFAPIGLLVLGEIPRPEDRGNGLVRAPLASYLLRKRSAVTCVPSLFSFPAPTAGVDKLCSAILRRLGSGSPRF